MPVIDVHDLAADTIKMTTRHSQTEGSLPWWQSRTFVVVTGVASIIGAIVAVGQLAANDESRTTPIEANAAEADDDSDVSITEEPPASSGQSPTDQISNAESSVGVEKEEIGSGLPEYRVVVRDQPLTWNEAKTEAEAMGGHLATISSKSEQELIWQLVSNEPSSWSVNSVGYFIGPWLGGYQVAGSQEPDGGWAWVTGEPFIYSSWIRSSSQGGRQPNDASGIEDALVFMGWNEMSPGWNDYPGSPSGLGWQVPIRAFVVEIGVDPVS